MVRRCRGRQLRPGDRELAVQVVCAGGLQVGDELAEQPFLAFELEAERAPQRHVLLDVANQGAHLASPGHGAASLRSSSRSTRA